MSERLNPVPRRRLLGMGLGVAALAACSAPPSAQPPAPPGRTAGAEPPAPPSLSSQAQSAVHPSPAPGAATGGPATELMRGLSGRPEVALTFHGAGDVAITRQVLAALAEHGALVTVFAVGTWLAASPDGARMVLDGGHELGNHTWSHPALASFQPEPMRVEIERCRDRLDELTGSPGAFFRQSQGQHATAEELRQAGRAGYPRVLSYDIDSLDWRDPGPAAIRRAVAAASPGSVVSMHLGHAGTVAAVPGILADLAARGLSAVTASKLVS